MPFAANDFQEPYLRAVFRFIGIEEIEIIRAEGIAFGPEHKEAAIQAALADVAFVVDAFAPERIRQTA